jgi:hypothetical protein
MCAAVTLTLYPDTYRMHTVYGDETPLNPAKPGTRPVSFCNSFVFMHMLMLMFMFMFMFMFVFMFVFILSINNPLLIPYAKHPLEISPVCFPPQFSLIATFNSLISYHEPCRVHAAIRRAARI